MALLVTNRVEKLVVPCWGALTATRVKSLPWSLASTFNWTAAPDVDPGLHSATCTETRPFFDENGVHRFEGDVLDVENHPTTGAQGRI